MRITFKLYASLTDYLPVERRAGNAIELDVAEGASVAEIIAPFSLPMKMVHLVLINGHYVPPDQRGSRVLKQDDVLAIWPPIAGG
jgi:sulfur carrier protein ThiS